MDIDFKVLFESAPVPVLVLNTNLNIITASDAYLQATMTKRDDIIGKNIFFVFPDNPNDPTADGVQKLRNSLERVIKIKKQDVMGVQKYDIRRPDTQFEERYWEPINSPILDKNNEISYILHQVRDITELIKTQKVSEDKSKKLIESEEKLRLLVNHIKDCAIFMLDNQGNVSTWNKGAESIKGYKSHEVLGKHVSMFYQDHERAKKTLQEAEKQGSFKEIVNLVRKDGSIFVADVMVTALYDDDGNLRGFAKIARDITEKEKQDTARKVLEEKLLRSNKELEQFAYVAAHDLQEPLRMVASYCKLIEKRYKDKLDNDGIDFINFAVDGARRMQQLINDLLQYSRVSTRGKELTLIDANKCLQYSLRILDEPIKDAKAKITFGDLPSVMADDIQLSQVFQNLISNAIKFSNIEPVVNISCEKTNDGFYKFCVKDNGIGISENDKNRLFIIFQRLHNNDKRSGTGIGLAICRKIIERHGGKIWFDSKIGVGSRFFFTLKQP